MPKHLFASAALALSLLATPVAGQQGPADPVVVEALKEIEKYEGLAKSLQPGDRTTASTYINALNPLGDRLKGVGDKQHPQWRDAASRYNALQKEITATARKPAPAQPAAAGTAAPAPARPAAAGTAAPAPTEAVLNSSDKARLARVRRNIASLGQDIDKARDQTLADEKELSRFSRSIENEAGSLEKLPAGHAEVAPALEELEAVKAKLAARASAAKSKIGALGDIDAQLSAIDQHLGARKVPVAHEFKPDGPPDQAAAFAKTLVAFYEQSVADGAVLEKLKAAGIKDERIDRFRHWAVTHRQREITEVSRTAMLSMDAHVKGVLDKTAFLDATDPANADHRANRLLGKGARDAYVGELKAGLAAIETAKSFEAALGRKDAPDRAAQAARISASLAGYEGKFTQALSLSRMPKAGMTDTKYIKIAEEVLKNPSYQIAGYKRLVINSDRVQRKEKKEADLRAGTSAGTVNATIYHWVWDEYQVATAEKDGDAWYVYFNTLKFFHQGASTTPTGRWLISDRFQSTRILEENIGK